LAGSTHAGEESLVLDAFARLLDDAGPNFHLVLAPRDVSRSDRIGKLAVKRGLSIRYFSTAAATAEDVTIIDTIGDLPTLYRFADLSFIGGSLVDEGGHNPLEATRMGSPVLFGPHMDDFSEIGQQLQDCGAALQVKNGIELYECLALLMNNETKRKEMGDRALKFSTGHDHVIADHLELIDTYL
jgi:3-deoxy-D-manno-octulosonic-acid transferase